MYDRLLLPLDGSDCAAAAIPHASAIAERFDATVYLLRVLDSRGLENAKQADALQDEAAAALEDVAASFAERDVPTEQSVRNGVPETVIRDAVDETGIDLVTMGTHGRSGLERYVLGSVAESLLRKSGVQVLAVPEAATETAEVPYHDVLVPTDGSVGAEAAIDAGIDVAGAFDAGFHALSVVPDAGLGPEFSSTRALEDLEHGATEAVEAAKRRATEAGLADVTPATRSGHPHQGIEEYVADEGIDLIVLARHGRSGLERYLLGSVTERVLRTASVPVLTVRIPTDDEE